MPIFEATGTGDPLGLWTSTPQPGPVHFGMDGVEATPAPGAPVFRVNLPDGGNAAREAFEFSEAYFERVDAALDEIPARLNHLVAQMSVRDSASPRCAPGAVSFEAAGPQAEPGLEGGLLRLLEEASRPEAADSGAETVQFGIEEPLSQAWQEAKARFEALLEQINREVLHFAWVETKIDGQIIARSEVGWSGDATTLWVENVSEKQQLLHRRALNLATRSRSTKLRLFVTVAGGAAKVTTLMTTGAPVLALPAIYQYVTSILQQVKQDQSIS